MAARLAASAPLSISLTKKYLNDHDLTLDEVLAIEETTHMLWSWGSKRYAHKPFGCCLVGEVVAQICR